MVAPSVLSEVYFINIIIYYTAIIFILCRVTFFSVLFNWKSYLSVLHSCYKGPNSYVLLSLVMVKKAKQCFNCSSGVIVR